MDQQHWDLLDIYICTQLVPADEALEAALLSSAQAGLPSINVAPNQGKFLQLLARIRGARRILEIGTLGRYSSIWLARGLQAGGALVTLEADPGYAEVATRNIAFAGLSETVSVMVGLAAQTLAQMIDEKSRTVRHGVYRRRQEDLPGLFAVVARIVRARRHHHWR